MITENEEVKGLLELYSKVYQYGTARLEKNYNGTIMIRTAKEEVFDFTTKVVPLYHKIKDVCYITAKRCEKNLKILKALDKLSDRLDLYYTVKRSKNHLKFTVLSSYSGKKVVKYRIKLFSLNIL